MSIINDLWFGNLVPFEREIAKGSEEDNLSNLIIRYDDELIATLTNQQKEMLNNMKSKQSDLNCLLEYDAFEEGFKLSERQSINQDNCYQYSQRLLRLFVDRDSSRRVV